MAEVLTPPSQTEPGFPSTSISRDTSQGSLCSQRQAYSTSTTTNQTANHSRPECKFSASITSSAPSSPSLQVIDSSSPTSLLSTPPSTLSLDESYCEQREDSAIELSRLPNQRVDGVEVPPSSPFDEDGVVFGFKGVYDGDASSDSVDTPAAPELIYQSVGDDIALTREPSRHVDYLSHDWREEDIWCSWRHIISRRNNLENSERLENAAWRTWAKCRNGLRTVSPEKLNWMKDHDVTWLYGPLQTITPQNLYIDSLESKNGGTRSASFLCKKPILKKHSMSEVMLRKSLSNSTLVRQAVDALANQGTGWKNIRRRFSQRLETPTPRRQYFIQPSPLQGSSATPSGTHTPGTEKHIHFNDEVEQCIAINKDSDDVEDFGSPLLPDDPESESSDDGILMMPAGKRDEQNLSSLSARSTPRGSFSAENSVSKTIAMLPSTTLKYRGDTPEPAAEARPPSGHWFSEKKLFHSPSSETLKPARLSTNFLLDDEDEHSHVERLPSIENHVNPRGSRHHGGFYFGENLEEDEDMYRRGLRRTSSGMLMPYEIDEDQEYTGIFSKVVDTVNTARDIAHVIWNVGWRR